MIGKQSVLTNNVTINSQQAIISGIFKVNEYLGCHGADGDQGGKLMIAFWKSCCRCKGILSLTSEEPHCEPQGNKDCF